MRGSAGKSQLNTWVKELTYAWQEAEADGRDWWEVGRVGRVQWLHQGVSGQSQLNKHCALLIRSHYDWAASKEDWSIEELSSFYLKTFYPRTQLQNLRRMRLTILTTLWTLSEKGRRGNMRGWRAPSGSPAFSSAGLLLPLSPSMWWLPSSLAILSPHSRMNCDYTRKYATPPQPLLFQPHTLSSPFHMLHPFSESHFHLFRPYHGLWSLQEGLYWVDRDGSGKEPHPHFGGALQVAPHQAQLKTVFWLKVLYFVLLQQESACTG